MTMWRESLTGAFREVAEGGRSGGGAAAEEPVRPLGGRAALLYGVFLRGSCPPVDREPPGERHREDRAGDERADPEREDRAQNGIGHERERDGGGRESHEPAGEQDAVPAAREGGVREHLREQEQRDAGGE